MEKWQSQESNSFLPLKIKGHVNKILFNLYLVVQNYLQTDGFQGIKKSVDIIQ